MVFWVFEVQASDQQGTTACYQHGTAGVAPQGVAAAQLADARHCPRKAETGCGPGWASPTGIAIPCSPRCRRQRDSALKRQNAERGDSGCTACGWWATGVVRGSTLRTTPVTRSPTPIRASVSGADRALSCSATLGAGRRAVWTPTKMGNVLRRTRNGSFFLPW